jgi:hypothetical protein
MDNKLTPGLRGTYEDSCIVCLQGTDTAIVLQGEPEWVVAVYMKLGIPAEQGSFMVSSGFGCAPGMVPIGEITVQTKLCQDCAGPLPVGLDAGQQRPMIRQHPGGVTETP